MRRLLGDGGVIVCAISGGADSMALLHGLVRVREMRKRDWTLHVAHLDHGIPRDSAEMMQFVAEAAEAAGVPCHRDQVDVPALSKATNESIEEAGRKARYAFLERICVDVDADALAVAHHADDQAETILHRIFRGTGLGGLAGIPATRALRSGVRARLIRPLLEFRRSDCVGYLDHRGLQYMHDDTNADVLAATRNRIRHEVLPAIEREINPQAVTAIVRLGDIARRTAALVDVLTDEAFERCCVERSAHELSFDVEALSEERDVIRMALIGAAVERVGGGRSEVGYERLVSAANAIDGGRRDMIVEFPGGVSVVRRGRFVIVSNRANAERRGAAGRAVSPDAGTE